MLFSSNEQKNNKIFGRPVALSLPAQNFIENLAGYALIGLSALQIIALTASTPSNISLPTIAAPEEALPIESTPAVIQAPPVIQAPVIQAPVMPAAPVIVAPPAAVPQEITLSLPLPNISSHFGMRRISSDAAPRMHKGIDFSAPAGTPVKISLGGKVVFAGQKKGYGEYVMIEHKADLRTAYAHLSRRAKGLKVGKQIAAGEVIGYVGRTGNATGNHLHYEVISKGRFVDPLKFRLQPTLVASGISSEKVKSPSL